MLTSTYFDSPPLEDNKDKRRYGYSRDKHSDCVQVVIALIINPGKGFRSPARFCPEIRPTKPRCAPCGARSKPNTARPSAFG